MSHSPISLSQAMYTTLELYTTIISPKYKYKKIHLMSRSLSYYDLYGRYAVHAITSVVPCTAVLFYAVEAGAVSWAGAVALVALPHPAKASIAQGTLHPARPEPGIDSRARSSAEKVSLSLSLSF